MMQMNLGSALGMGLQTYEMTGNPILSGISAFAGGVLGGGTTAANLTGAAGNGGLGALNSADEAFQLYMYGEQIRHQEQMQVQSQAFDEMMDEKSEQMREVNTLRDVQMAQRKADNSITKKFIESITE